MIQASHTFDKSQSFVKSFPTKGPGYNYSINYINIEIEICGARYVHIIEIYNKQEGEFLGTAQVPSGSPVISTLPSIVGSFNVPPNCLPITSNH
jgi:hypothetical protein